MIRTIVLNDRPIEINSSMGWLYVYQRTFGHDILPDILPLAEAVIAGLGDALQAAIDDGSGKKSVSTEDLLGLMNADSFVEMFIKLAGMELTTILDIFWAMVKNADPTIPGPEQYFNSFDRLPLVDELAPALFYVIMDSAASSKNASSLLARIEKAMPSILTLLPSPESTEG